MKRLIYFLGSLCFLWSCEKSDNSTDTKNHTSDYLPLVVGNYWVYQNFYDDHDGIFKAYNSFDSSVISKDTLIKGSVFYKFEYYETYYSHEKPKYFYKESTYLRDSSKFLIDEQGKKYFSEYITGDTLLKKTIIIDDKDYCWITYTMEKTDSIVNTPFGSFNDVLFTKGTVISNSELVNIDYPRYVGNFYAKNIGKILLLNTTVSGDDRLEKRLIRYNIIK